MKKIKSKKTILFIMFLLVMLISLTLFSFTKSTEIDYLDNDMQLELNSSLIYYLKVTYDGVDRDSYDSRVPKEGVTSKLLSGYIYVEDKIPGGLMFDGFIKADDGTVGVVNPTTGKTCHGYIVDEVEPGKSYTINDNGLFYDETTRTVSFRVKEMQAGCELIVGIKTITPDAVDDPKTPLIETRRDFYNFATAREENLLKYSNIVHSFIQKGSSDIELSKVTYQYEGDVPSNAPKLPEVTSYAPNASVSIASFPYLEGYKFSGWKIKTESGTIVPATSISFIMPNEDVILTGSFETLTPHTVTYEVTGIPESIYTPPEEKIYYKNQIVTLDTTKEGEVINGYRFLGWKYSDIIVNNDEFIMPDEDVIITGEFEEVKYKVIYSFYDVGAPSDSDSLLPDTKEYRPGDVVTLDWVKSEPEGYKFAGWYKDDNFSMPDEDVVIYGEWALKLETFTPTITKEIIDKKDKYSKGETVKYKITVTNPETFAINNIQVRENNSKAKFVLGEGYTVITDLSVSIPIIQANTSVILYSQYTITDESGMVTNEVEITGASVSNNHELNTEVEYKARASFNLNDTMINICKVVSNDLSNDDIFSFRIEGERYDSTIRVSNGECESVYLDEGTYKIWEVPSQEYSLESITLDKNGVVTNINNGDEVSLNLGSALTLTFTNKHIKKNYFHSNGEIINKVEPRMFTVTYTDGFGGVLFEDQVYKVAYGNLIPPYQGETPGCYPHPIVAEEFLCFIEWNNMAFNNVYNDMSIVPIWSYSVIGPAAPDGDEPADLPAIGGE